MLKYNVIISERAEMDIKIICDYILINFGYKEYAENTKNMIITFLDSLAVVPKRFNVYNKGIWKKHKIRKGSVKDYCVFYYVDDDKKEVQVYKIVHSKMDYDNNV